MARKHLFTNLQDFDKLFDENTITNLHRFAKEVENVLCPSGSETPDANSLRNPSWMRHDILKSSEGMYLVLIDIPGVQKSDINLTVVESSTDEPSSSLKISVERSKTTEGVFVHNTRPYGRYDKYVNLPKDVDVTQNIEAKYVDGVLTVHIRRKLDESSKSEGRKVPIN